MGLIPTKIESLLGEDKDSKEKNPKIVRLGSGEYHCFAVDHKGDVYGWGLNNFGQLGLGWRGGHLPTGTKKKKVRKSKEKKTGDDEEDGPDESALNNIVESPMKVTALCPPALGGGRRVVDIAAGEHHSLFLVSCTQPPFFHILFLPIAIPIAPTSILYPRTDN